jgi:hypothetical protein
MLLVRLVSKERRVAQLAGSKVAEADKQKLEVGSPSSENGNIVSNLAVVAPEPPLHEERLKATAKMNRVKPRNVFRAGCCSTPDRSTVGFSCE